MKKTLLFLIMISFNSFSQIKSLDDLLVINSASDFERICIEKNLTIEYDKSDIIQYSYKESNDAFQIATFYAEHNKYQINTFYNIDFYNEIFDGIKKYGIFQKIIKMSNEDINGDTKEGERQNLKLAVYRIKGYDIYLAFGNGSEGGYDNGRIFLVDLNDVNRGFIFQIN